MTGIPGAIKEVGALLNKLFGNYKRRVRASLISTGDCLVETIKNKHKFPPKRKEKLLKHYCRKWRTNRKKLR